VEAGFEGRLGSCLLRGLEQAIESVSLSSERLQKQRLPELRLALPTRIPPRCVLQGIEVLALGLLPSEVPQDLLSPQQDLEARPSPLTVAHFKGACVVKSRFPESPGLARTFTSPQEVRARPGRLLGMKQVMSDFLEALRIGGGCRGEKTLGNLSVTAATICIVDGGVNNASGRRIREEVPGSLAAEKLLEHKLAEQALRYVYLKSSLDRRKLRIFRKLGRGERPIDDGSLFEDIASRTLDAGEPA
jgi:hypothetical protein